MEFCLELALLETPKTGFLATRPIYTDKTYSINIFFWIKVLYQMFILIYTDFLLALQVSVSFYIEQEIEPPSFDIQVHILRETTDMLSVETCAKYVYFIKYLIYINKIFESICC